MSQYLNILGVRISVDSMEHTVKKATDFFTDDSGRMHKIYTPNPEIIYEAYRRKDYCDILNRADILIPDGIGVVYASRILGKPMPERVPGYDMVLRLFSEMDREEQSVYIFGGKPGVAEAAVHTMKENYPNVRFVGFHDGYFEDERPLIEEINRLKPDLLLVCLGAPKQEEWIDRHANDLDVKLAIGAGGSVDVMAGTAKRAPEFFIRHNLEWFYRLLKQPSRFVRMLRLPKFIITVILHGKKYLKEDE